MSKLTSFYVTNRKKFISFVVGYQDSVGKTTENVIKGNLMKKYLFKITILLN